MARRRWERRIADRGGLRCSSLVGMAVATLVLLAGCGQASSRIRVPSPTATATATATPLPSLPLSWQLAAQQLSVPPGVGGYPGAGLPSNFAVAPSDGNTAYACVIERETDTGGWSASAWVTHDRAAHWVEARNIASGQASSAPNSLRFCSMTVDQLDPQRAVVVVVWQATPDDFDLRNTSTLATSDGGTTWQQLTSSAPAIVSQLATWQGGTYAIREVGVGCPSACPVPQTTDLMISRDQLRTWQPIDQPIIASQQSARPFFRAFWLNPSSGELLAETDQNGAGRTEQLWDTRDGGQRWTQLPAPAIQSVVVQAPVAGQPWHACGVVGDAGPSSLMCSADGGQTWAARPNAGNIVAIGDDGAVLALAPGNASANGGAQQFALSRVAASAAAWQQLGTAQLTALWYAAAPGAGVLWSLQAGSGTPASDGTQDRLFTASYPSGG